MKKIFQLRNLKMIGWVNLPENICWPKWWTAICKINNNCLSRYVFIKEDRTGSNEVQIIAVKCAGQKLVNMGSSETYFIQTSIMAIHCLAPEIRPHQTYFFKIKFPGYSMTILCFFFVLTTLSQQFKICWTVVLKLYTT